MALWEGKSKTIMCQSLSFFFLKQETAILRAEK